MLPSPLSHGALAETSTSTVEVLECKRCARRNTEWTKCLTSLHERGEQTGLRWHACASIHMMAFSTRGVHGMASDVKMDAHVCMQMCPFMQFEWHCHPESEIECHCHRTKGSNDVAVCPCVCVSLCAGAIRRNVS